MFNAAKRLEARERHSVSEVAVISSASSLYGVNKCSSLNSKLLYYQRDGYARMGAPYDLYSDCDLDDIDVDRYKLFILPTSFEMRKELKNLLSRISGAKGKTVLFQYAPAYLTGGIEAVSETVGFEIGRLEYAPIAKGDTGDVLAAPYLYPKDADATVIRRFAGGEPACAYKRIGDTVSVYSACGNLDGGLLREIARLAGVHVYCDTAPVYVDSEMIGVYNSEPCRLNVGTDGVYEDLFSGRKYVTEQGYISLQREEMLSKMLVKID